MLLMMLFILALVFIVSRLPLSEVMKIMSSLFSLPLVLFIAVKCSGKPTIWTIDDKALTIQDHTSNKVIPLNTIDYVRNLKRSGGNLIIIKLKTGAHFRAWRNKLFESEDDLKNLCQSLKDSKIEYYDM